MNDTSTAADIFHRYLGTRTTPLRDWSTEDLVILQELIEKEVQWRAGEIDKAATTAYEEMCAEVDRLERAGEEE